MFAENLKKALAQSGLSISELAAQSGLSKVTIYQWLNGQNEPTLEKFQRLMATLPLVPAHQLIHNCFGLYLSYDRIKVGVQLPVVLCRLINQENLTAYRVGQQLPGTHANPTAKVSMWMRGSNSIRLKSIGDLQIALNRCESGLGNQLIFDLFHG